MFASCIFSISLPNSKNSKMRRDVGRKPLNVADEVRRELSGSPFKRANVSSEWLWEPLPSDPVQPRVQGFAVELVLPALVLRQDLFLGGLQDTIEPSENGQGQHDPLVYLAAGDTGRATGRQSAKSGSKNSRGRASIPRVSAAGAAVAWRSSRRGSGSVQF